MFGQVFQVILLLSRFGFYVIQSWDSFFRNTSAGAAPGQAYQAPPSLAVPRRNEVPVSALVPHYAAPSAMSSFAVDEKTIDDHLAVQAIIRSYQVFILLPRVYLSTHATKGQPRTGR